MPRGWLPASIPLKSSSAFDRPASSVLLIHWLGPPALSWQLASPSHPSMDLDTTCQRSPGLQAFD